MAKFVKIADLELETKSKLQKYWTPLWGKEYADAIVAPYSTAKKDAVTPVTESKK